MPNEKYRGRGSIPMMTDPPQSATTEMPLFGAKIPSTGPFVPGRSRFPSPGGGGTPPGFEFAQDTTEALLKSLFQNLTNPGGFAKTVIDAEARRQLAAASRQGDTEATLSTLWRSIPGLPLIVSQKTFVNWALNRPDAVSAAKGFATQAPTPTDATTGP
jgi:hypothetical protein